MANKLIKSLAEKGLNYAIPKNQEKASVQSQEPIIKVNLDGKITRINNTKQPIVKVGLDGKITAINKKEKKKKSGFFQSSKYFDNGYDFGDISKTLFWSGADLLQDVTKGFSRTIEGTTDTLGYLSADVLDFFGADDTADWLRDVSKYDVTGKLIKDSDYLEQRSVFGNYSDTVFEGVGNVGGMIVTNAVMPGSGAKSTMLTSFSSAYGNSMSEALRNGADLKTARKSAIIHGTAEAISEQFFSGLPILKTENWGGKVVGKIGSGIEKYFGTNTGKIAMKILNTTGEGFEEIISNMLTSAGNDIMHWIDKDFTYGMEGQSGNALKDMWKAATSKESWDSFISASLTSALTNGSNQFISTTQKNNLIKSYAKENNMTVNQVKTMFNQSVQEKTQAEMQRQPNMNLGQRVETENMAKAKTMQELKRGTFVQPGTETDTYQYVKSENQKVNEMNQSIVDAGGNNTQANREVAATAKRLIEDLGFNIKFTNNQQLQEQGQNVNGKNINGFVKDGTMYLNLDSNELANFTIGHETKHFFEANKEMNDLLNQSLKEYAQEKGIWDKRLAETTELYTDKDGNLIGDPEGELLADLSGQFFTDYNFVSNLSTKNPTLFERAKDFFQKLYYKATGQKEKLLIKQINDNFSRAYREYAKTQPKQEGTKYSLSENEKKDLLNKNSELYKNVVEKKDIVRSTNELLDLLNNGVTQEQGTSLQILNKGKRPAEYGQQYIEFKPEILLHTDKIFNGDGATNRQQFVKESNKRFNNLQEILNNNPFIYDEILLEGNKPITEYIKSVTIPENSSQELINKLNELGIEINYYKPGLSYNETKEVNTEYSLSKDSQGRELTPQQQEYFKDSKVRDNEGKLLEVFHGTTSGGFNIFDSSKLGSTTQALDSKLGFHFTDNLGLGEMFADEKIAEGLSFNKGNKSELKSVYLNMVKPLDLNNLKYLKNIDENETFDKDLYYIVTGEKIDNQDQLDDIKEELKYNSQWNNTERVKDEIANTKGAKERMIELGYDGIIQRIQENDIMALEEYGEDDFEGNEYIVFNPNQIKNIDNINPTESPDIRYSLSNKDSALLQKEYDDIRNQRDDLRTELFELRQQRNEIINNIPDYSMFKQYDELTNINKALDENKQKSIELYEQEKQLEEQLKKVKEKEKQQEIKKINKKTTPFKDKQFALLQKTNPMLDDYHTGIRQPGEIRTWEEAMYDAEQDGDGYSWGDFSKEDAEKALKNKSITIYSSYPIKNGTFVSTSLAQAQMYAGGEGNRVYSKTVRPDNVAWINVDEGQYANVGINKYDSKFSLSQEGQDISEELDEFYTPKNKVTTRLSDLKRKEVELPTEQENALKTSENKQKEGAEKPTRREVIDRNRQLAREQLGDITGIKDKKRGILYQINTMKRNLRDIMSKEQAQKMYDTYFKDITTNNAKIENDITSYNERIQKYNLNDKESTYTQMIGELKHNPETTLTKQQVDDFYYKNANKIDQQKCENAVNEFRQIYDELIEKVNDVLTDNGYKPIDYRKGYFPHFIEEKATSKLGKFAEKLGWKVKKGQLPTDIAGITDQFKPGKAWTRFSQQRTGDATDYNALKGLDNYLRGAMDVIYHTNDIQKLRALENEIRYQYSSKGVQDKINEIYADENLDMEEKNDAIANLTSNIRESGLGNFVTEIRNYTDNLANKKAFGDRSMEQTLGRDVYSIMNNINGRVSANMVGANISSAITNFIPITQAWSQLSTKNLMRGMYESIKTSIKGDNFADRSTFLTNRTKQAERLYNTKMDKLTQKLGVPFEAIDSFTSNTIVRAKYYDNIAKGMTEQEAMANADEFAKDVMAGRSKGDQPTIFNRKNPLFKLFTAFQLEVNNQYGYMFKDIPTNMADEAKRKLVGAFIKMFLGAWLYNEITEKFTGRRAAFDPIDMAVSDIKTLTNEDMDLGDKIQSIVKDTAQEVPFVSGLAGGGRLPIQGAIPYSNPLEMVTKTFEDIGKLDDQEKRKTAINNLKKEWSKPVYYLLFPVAGGQVKKTVEGLSMYDKDLPIAGSYTNSGKLRFEADTSALGKVQAAVFGQYASKNAREYFKNGYTPLTEGQVEEALEAELPINEYREINQGIKDAKAEAKAKGENQTEAMYDYIYDLPIEMEQKNSLINSRTKGSSTVKDKNGYIKYVDDKGKTYWYDKKNDIVYNNKYKEMDTKDIADLTKASTQKDISNYGNYGSLAEFNYSNKNPEKYLALTKIADYDTFMEYKDELAAIKQKYDNKPTEFKKKKVFEYINSLPLSVEQKLMLQKMGAGYSIKQYRGRLHNYINNMELTKEQKQAIDKVLFD